MAANNLASRLGSFRKNELNPSDLLDATRELVRGLADQVIVADPEEHRTLRRKLHSVRSRMGSPDCHQAVEEALRLLREYNAKIGEMVAAVSSAFPRTISQLTDSLTRLCDAGEAATRRLDAIERALSEPVEAQDLHATRKELLAHLHEARLASAEHSALFDQAIRDVIRECRAIAEQSPWAMAVQRPSQQAVSLNDKLTGLPGRAAAETVLAGLTADSAQAAVYHLHQYRVIQEKYGTEGGNRFILEFSRHLSQALKAPNTLFRWSESSFVGITAGSAGDDLHRLGADRNLCDLDLDGRSAMVPMACRSELLPVGTTPPENLFATIDRFVNALS